MLKDRRSVSVEYFREILKTTHQNTLGVRTLYSNIYDLKNGIIHLYYLHNYDNAVIINLNEELKKGRHYYEIPSLFGKKVSYEKKEYVHHAPAFRIFYPKQYKVVTPEANQVFKVRNSFGGVPEFSVSVIDRPPGMPLRDFGEKANISEIKSRKLDDVRPGGLGVHLIRCVMDKVVYDNSFEIGNQLQLVKFFKKKD